MNSQTFEGVGKAAIDKFVAELGANITSDEQVAGEVTYTILDNGFHATAVWDQGASTLAVTVLGKPWYVPMELIWHKLENELDEELEEEKQVEEKKEN